MSRREGQLFVGRLSKTTRTRDLEEIFEPYGRLTRCEVKYGVEVAYAFVDFEDYRDAEDCIKYENGRDVCGSSIIVEWAKGSPRRPLCVDGYRATMNATVVIGLVTGRGIVLTTVGVEGSAAVGLDAVATRPHAEGEATQDRGLEIAADAQGRGQEIAVAALGPATAAVAPEAAAATASPPEGSPTTARTASPGTGSQGASQGAARGPSPNRTQGPSRAVGPQSSRMGTGTVVTQASRRTELEALPGAALVVPTDGLFVWVMALLVGRVHDEGKVHIATAVLLLDGRVVFVLFFCF